MLNTIDGPSFLRLGVTHADAVIEFLVHGDVNKFIDRRRNDRAAKFAIEHRKVTASSHKAHSQWRFADNHRVVKLIGVTSAYKVDRRSHLQQTNAAPTLFGVFDELLAAPVFLHFVPELIDMAVQFRRVSANVVKSDQTTLADERRVHLEVLLDPRIRMIAVN